MTKKHSPENPSALRHRDRFINREISWLAFNNRVLEEAYNPQVPLLERVNFLSISSSNLNEFYMVRVAGLLDQQLYNTQSLSNDHQTPAEQLEKIRAICIDIMGRQQDCWAALRKELKARNINVIQPDHLHKKEREWLKEYFFENMFPVLTPIAIDPAHPFPFIPNLGIAQLFSLQSHDGKHQRNAVLLFPTPMKRFIRLPIAEGKRAQRLILAEDVISLFLDALFPGFTATDSAMLRIVRDSDLELEEDAEDLVQHFERALARRRRGRVIRIMVSPGMSENLQQLVHENLPVDPQDTLVGREMVGVSQLNELVDLPRPDLRFSVFTPRFPERISDFEGDCFAAIAAKDIVVHHPYESFDVVVQFLRQAARDPDVISIKLTLYRTSKDSPIIQALIDAAENGKSVTAVVELKARFDEEANIKWARDLERAGVQVVYGFVRLKTHSKVTLVSRKSERGLQSFVHYGTGNYHPSTAKIYTDLSYFTTDPVLTMDAAFFFNFVTGNAAPRDLTRLIVAPNGMRKHILGLIEAEMHHAKHGRPATIWAKMNSLLDAEVIDALYAASQVGVKITLVIRGICSLRPGVDGLSENIIVKSIVGRFLEHARIYCFGNGNEMPSEKAKVYIGSADWMPRNFDKRVELMVPIENPTVHAQILSQIMVANIRDEKQSWLLQADESYKRVEADESSFSAHDYFIKNPSLSGRGKALQKAGKPDLFERRKH